MESCFVALAGLILAIAHTDLKLMAVPACLSLPSAQITGMCHHPLLSASPFWVCITSVWMWCVLCIEARARAISGAVTWRLVFSFPLFLLRQGLLATLNLKNILEWLAWKSLGTVLVHIPSARITRMSSFYYWGLYSLHHLSYLPTLQMTSLFFSGEKCVFAYYVCQGLSGWCNTHGGQLSGVGLLFSPCGLGTKLRSSNRYFYASVLVKFHHPDSKTY